MKKIYRYKKIITIVVALFLTQLTIAQFKIPEKPKFQTSVYDYVGLLSPVQKITLENKLIKYSDSTSTQIVVAVIKSTDGEYINYLATNWAQKWGIGQKKKDNGVFILLAKEDKKIAIQTGYGVEHLLTDFTSRKIIETEIIPQFKRGDFYSGLNKGSDAIFKVLKGEYKGTRKQKPKKKNGLFPLIFMVIIIIIIILFIRGKNNKGGGNGNSRNLIGIGILEAIILSSAGRGFGGGFGGSSGGGGFSGGGFGGGFGGGGFGGGGASGSW